MPQIPLTKSELGNRAVYILSLRDKADPHRVDRRVASWPMQPGVFSLYTSESPPQGSEPMKLPKILHVIADGGRARFVARGEEGDFHTIASFVSSDIHERSHDFGTDRPARSRGERDCRAARPPAAPCPALGRLCHAIALGATPFSAGSASSSAASIIPAGNLSLTLRIEASSGSMQSRSRAPCTYPASDYWRRARRCAVTPLVRPLAT